MYHYNTIKMIKCQQKLVDILVTQWYTKSAVVMRITVKNMIFKPFLSEAAFLSKKFKIIKET